MKPDILDVGKKALELEADAVAQLSGRLGCSFLLAVDLLTNCRGRAVLTGMGKSGLIGRKIAATLSSTGRPALYLNPAEAIHGDLGMLVSGDVVIAISHSGETTEIVRLLERIKRLGDALITITGNLSSTLAEQSDVVLDVSVACEAGPLPVVPTTSTTATLAMGDALAVAVIANRGFTEEDFREFHPGGHLGSKLLKVKHVMHTGESVPCTAVSTSMRDVLSEMSAKSLGMTCVVDETGKLTGIFTDGDLRRLVESSEDALNRTAGECMTTNPITIGSEEMATAALFVMETRKITSLVVPDDKGRILGVVQIHDLWRTQFL